MNNVGFLPMAERRLNLEISYLKKVNATARVTPLLKKVVTAIEQCFDHIATDVAAHKIPVEESFTVLLQEGYDQLHRVKTYIKENDRE